MWQRPHTLFFVFTLIGLSLASFLPLWQVSTQEKTLILQLPSLLQAVIDGQSPYAWLTLLLVALMLLSLVISLFSLLLYKKRRRQLRWCSANFLSIGAVIALVFYLSSQTEKMLSTDIQGDFMEGSYCLIAAMAGNLFARRSLLRDQSLIKNAQRFR